MDRPVQHDDAMATYDAVICGAGPSGATAAKYMADAGLDVVVLEKKRFPRDKPCGGALRTQVLSEFAHVERGIRKIPHTVSYRAKMYPPSLQNCVDYNPGKVVMYNIHRRHFDAMLADMARDAGAELRENEEVVKVSVSENGGAVQLRGGEEVFGKVIIGAGGMHDPVARYMRKKEAMPEKWPKSDIGLVMVEEYDVGEDYVNETYGKERTCHFHLKPNNLYGYAWVFPKNNMLNIGFGAFWSYMMGLDIKSAFGDYITMLKKEGLVPIGLKPKHPKGAQIPLRGAIKTTYSDRILLLGDAAGFVSPIGGDGIYYAMSSGRIAADVVGRCTSQNSYVKSTLRRYQDKWFQKWGRDLEVLCYFADKIFEKTEQVIRYAAKDSLFRDMCIRLYDGKIPASALKGKILRRMVRNFLLYDILRTK
jgi:geranylgeranyl reductase family protein